MVEPTTYVFICPTSCGGVIFVTNRPDGERRFAGIEQLSIRSLLLGVLGSCVITASSMYVALRMSALPWPTIFVAVLSMALLKALGRTTHNEINVTQTAMSAGAMVAGGLAFTLPGLWIKGIWKGQAFTAAHFWAVLAIALAGVLLGSVLTWYLRRRFVVTEALPYPIGRAAAETIVVGDSGGKKSAVLFSTMGFSAVFTYLRDGLAWIPNALTSKWLYVRNFSVGIWVSPMAAGIGYMIGTLYTGVWFAGSVFAYLIIVPAGLALGLFPSGPSAVDFKNTVGIGLMVGTGIGVLLDYVISAVRRIAASNGNARKEISSVKTGRENLLKPRPYWAVLAVGVAFVLTTISGLGTIPSLLVMVGVLFASAMAATITGQTGINPMETFGIIVLLGVRLLVPVSTAGAFFVAGVVAVACGYAGDLLNDYKTGHVLGTNPLAQLVSQVAGGLAGAVVASLAMFAVIGQFGGVGAGTGLPAGQAVAVSKIVGGIGSPWVFGIAATVAVLLYLLKVPAMTLGIGMYLPFEISSVVFLGGMARSVVDRFRPSSVETGTIAASGLLGGEGITGVGIALVKLVIGG